MKIVYDINDLIRKHPELSRFKGEIPFERAAEIYGVHKKTVQAWFKNDRVPAKYIEKNNWT